MAKTRIARGVHANAGTKARYQRRMISLIREMAASVEYWAKAQYRADPPELAQDALPAAEMVKALKKLTERWEKRFDDMAPTVAASFLKNQFRGTDVAMREALKAAGWTVKFTMTPAVRDAFEASLAENVGLIKSIPAQYLQEVEGIVMRSFAAGRDLKTMATEIRGRYHVAANRAVLIARDQSNKASAVVTKARQTELGITRAKWLHSHAGKEPRPSHVRMNGKEYDVEKGMWDPDAHGKGKGDWVYPGQLINCRCVGRSILPFIPVESSK